MRKFILVIVIFSLFGTIALAWSDCPYGRVNDPFPGLCRRYADTNTDGLCDHSQPAPGSSAVIPPAVVNGTDQETGLSGLGADGNGTYKVVPMVVILSILYSLTYILSKKKIIKLADHRRIWNWALLATFIGVALLGLMLALCINYGWTVPFSTDSLFWHVELGIAMGVISVFHILWHWNYWKGQKECPDGEKPAKIKNRRNG